jgi:hypothetical protein
MKWQINQLDRWKSYEAINAPEPDFGGASLSSVEALSRAAQDGFRWHRKQEAISSGRENL